MHPDPYPCTECGKDLLVMDNPSLSTLQQSSGFTELRDAHMRFFGEFDWTSVHLCYCLNCGSTILTSARKEVDSLSAVFDMMDPDDQLQAIFEPTPPKLKSRRSLFLHHLRNLFR